MKSLSNEQFGRMEAFFLEKGFTNWDVHADRDGHICFLNTSDKHVCVIRPFLMPDSAALNQLEIELVQFLRASFVNVDEGGDIEQSVTSFWTMAEDLHPYSYARGIPMQDDVKGF